MRHFDKAPKQNNAYYFKHSTLITRLVIVVVIIASLLLGGLLFNAKGANFTPINNKVERSGLIIQNATEASWFVWNNQLHYVYNNRNYSGSQTDMKIVRFSDNVEISTFGNGYGLQDVLVDNGTLYVFTTNQTTISKFSTTDLTNFTAASVVKTMPTNHRVFNVAAVKNTTTNEYVISYEVTQPGVATFALKFVKSSNLTTWSDTGSTIGGSWQASCPDLIYVNGYYYMYIGTGLPAEKIWNGAMFVDFELWGMWLARSTDLVNWGYSSAYTLYPESGHSNDAENFHKVVNGVAKSVKNNTDFDLIEFDGKVYILYMIGDQNTVYKLTYATYNGSMADLFTIYYK